MNLRPMIALVLLCALPLLPAAAFAVDPPLSTGLPEQIKATVTENPSGGALVPPPVAPVPAPDPAPAGPPAAAAPLPAATAHHAATAGINEFAFDLYREVAKTENGNLFCSPFSISTALAMTASGARGPSLEGMEKAMRVKSSGATLHAAFGALVHGLNEKGRAGNFELAVANRLFGQRGKAFLPDFLALIDRCYGSGAIEPLDFGADPRGATKRINDWVAEATRDKIKDLIPDGVIKALTRLVLVNAIYFKGKWKAEFEKSATKDEPFTGDDGAKSQAPLMRRKAKMPYAEAGGAKAVELPYRADELSMIAILPPEGTPLAAWAAGMTWEKLEPLVAALDERPTELFLPRFKLESAFLLKEPLVALGMGHAFSDDADFSGMDGTNLLKISEVVHKAFVDVNEEGTEAAAATAVIMIEKSAFKPDPPAVFRADRPFLFLIRDNATGAILFLGRVMKP